MSESTQHILTRIRSPRVQITYDVEIGDAVEKKELPFVIGVLSDLAGQTQKEIPSLKERKFIEVDRDNFSDVMTALMPRLSFSVPALGGGENAQLSVELFFESINDFSPERIVKQIPSLEKIYTSRVRLTDLVSKLDGHDGLDAELQKLFGSPELLQRLQQEALSEEGAETPEINRMIEDGQAVRDPSQMENARALLKEFILQLAGAGEDFPKDSYGFILQSIKKLDNQLSEQLDEILHHPDFQKLESSWRGFHYLVTNSETGEGLKLRLLQISQKEMVRDLEKAMEFDQSQLFKKVYEEEYGTFGGNPFSCLVADFEFGRHPQEIETLRKLSNIAAAAHAPLLTAASSKLFDMGSFGEIGNPRDLGKIFESTELIKWNSFRKTEDSRYVALLLPHVLMRQPYGAATSPVETFDYEEQVDGEDNRNFCWGNPAYVMAQRIANAFALYGWTAAIRGVEGGGLVENLPVYSFKTTNGDLNMKCPTEVTITDRREKELSDLGFIALCHCKGKDFAAFFGGQTAQKPKIYNTEDANANALVSTRLPYMLNASRFAHYIKVMMRDKIGSFMSRDDVADYLQDWIGDYILLSDAAPQEIKAQFPLREAKVEVLDVPGKPGAYKAVLFLRPHFQLEELTASLRLVANLPAPVA